MRYFVYSSLVLCLSIALVSAQTCSAYDAQIAMLLEECQDITPDSLCTSDAVTADPDDIEIEALSEIVALTIDEEDSSLMMRLNRQESPLYVIALGDLMLENTASQTTITVTATRNVNLRALPSAEASVIGSLTIRQEYTAIGRLSDNTWIRVRLGDGRIGWASAQFFVTQEGFTMLEATTPTTPPYVPFQSMTVSASDCGLLLLMATQAEIADDTTDALIFGINGAQITIDGVVAIRTQDDTTDALIFGINGAQITIDGVVAIRTQDDTLYITSISGEHTVNAFGFEIDLIDNQQTTIPLSSANSIASIPTDAEAIDPILDDTTRDALLKSP